MGREHVGHGGQHAVDTGKRTALITRDEGGHPAAGSRVAFVLLHQRTGDGLDAGEHHGTGPAAITIAQFVRLARGPANVEIGHVTTLRSMGVLLPPGFHRYAE